MGTKRRRLTAGGEEVKLPGTLAKERRMGTARGGEGEEWKWADETRQTEQLERHRELLSPLFLVGTRNQQGLLDLLSQEAQRIAQIVLRPTSLPEPGPRKVRRSQHVRRDS